MTRTRKYLTVAIATALTIAAGLISGNFSMAYAQIGGVPGAPLAPLAPPPAPPAAPPAAGAPAPVAAAAPATTIQLAPAPAVVQAAATPVPQVFRCSCFGTGIGTGWVGQIQAASFTQASQSAMGQCVANKLNAKPGSPYIQPPAFGFGSSFPNPATNIPGNVLNPYVLTQQPGATSPGNVSKLGAASGCTRCTCN
ncbi:MAG TPA: hypothetical protein VEF03_03250 [Candidatus Binataceae bacterium]|nr:hypothetical protein [Candidatus Binataceae bacterium]